jgi:hypothetical protein
MDKKKKIFSVILFIIIFTFNVEASDWVRVDLNTREDVKKHFLNLKRISQAGTMITFWEKYLYPDNSSIMMKCAVNCERNEFKILDIRNYNAQGKAINIKFPSSEWTAINPYSERMQVPSLICRNGKPLHTDKIADIRFYRKHMLGLHSKNKH